MLKKQLFLSFTLISLMISCGENPPNENESDKVNEKPTEVVAELVDQHSYANILAVKTTHLHLNLTVDFESKKLKGNVVHTIENSTGATTMVFDARDLQISKILLDDSIETDYEMGEPEEYKGQALTVSILPETKRVTIFYETVPSASALQWLNPQQTAGKENPYLFTQGEAVLTRSWIPCQDTPANRITYSADIQVPADLMAVMSAENPTKKNENGTYHFEMEKPIPTYLIALAVGDLQFASLGDRTGVYAEPSMIDKSVYEFADVEKMIVAAEELYGAYQWERYDIIVLPPSFPFGGMENPKLTFATPTILAGDRSLVSLIAHELAHSWSGNLVTNATWDDFWLNEGFTVYFENRIMEKVYGQDYADMLFSIEYAELKHENEEILSGDYPEDTQLKLDLEGRDPDDGMTAIAYVKGALFLKTLEEAVGRDTFDVFVNQYFEDNQFNTMTTEAFVDYLQDNLLTPNDITFNTNQWIYEEGIPENAIKVTSDRFARVEEKSAKVPTIESVKELDINEDKWSTQEWMHFIREIPEETNTDKFALLDDAYNFSTCGNSEIMAEWYVKSIQNGYEKINPAMETFLIEVGRRKFLEPIYTALAKTEKGMELAQTIYKKARPNYHSISYNTIDEILNWQG